MKKRIMATSKDQSSQLQARPHHVAERAALTHVSLIFDFHLDHHSPTAT